MHILKSQLPITHLLCESKSALTSEISHALLHIHLIFHITHTLHITCALHITYYVYIFSTGSSMAANFTMDGGGAGSLYKVDAEDEEVREREREGEREMVCDRG